MQKTDSDWFMILLAIVTFSGRKKTPGGEGERIEFHAWRMRDGRPVLAGVGVNGLITNYSKAMPKELFFAMQCIKITKQQDEIGGTSQLNNQTVS